MRWIIAGVLLAAAAFILIVRARRRSITGSKSERKHFRQLSELLGLSFVSDDYFVQLEGLWNGIPVIILPHHFEGPGSVTLIYLQTKIPVIQRNWIEPNLSLGRALVESRRKSSYGYEISGRDLPAERILNELKTTSFPYVAFTLPHRFSYSPLLQKSLESWTHFVVLIALDEGRKPTKEKITHALKSAERIAKVL
jgi:hypothetical protein